MSEYAKLCEELTALPALAKSEPAAPETPPAAEAAAPEPAVAEAAAEAAEAGAGGAEEAAADDEGKAEPAKPETATLADGTVFEFEDAGPAIDELRGDLAKSQAALAEQGEVVRVSAGLLKSLHGVVAEQADLIKSLRADVERLGNSGAGRKGVVLAKAQAPAAPAPKQETYPDLMAKALAAQASGAITGHDVNRIVAANLRGLSVPEDVAAKIAAI